MGASTDRASMTGLQSVVVLVKQTPTVDVLGALGNFLSRVITGNGLQGLRAHREQQEQLQKIAKLLEDVPAFDAAKGPWLNMVLQETETLPAE